MSEETTRPVVVFHGRNELEAQMARDALQAAGLPVLHLPSLSTGIFGVPQTTRVAVPEPCVPEAVQALQEAGFAAAPEPPATGLAAFGEAAREALPLPRQAVVPWRTRLGLALMVILAAMIALSVLAVLRQR